MTWTEHLQLKINKQSMHKNVKRIKLGFKPEKVGGQQHCTDPTTTWKKSHHSAQSLSKSVNFYHEIMEIGLSYC
jgi:hypothetical protein